MVEFSIIIPAYNVEKYIEQALKSVLLQTFKDFEVICIDDGSTDKTLKIIEKYKKKDHRIKILKTKKHIGPGGARNLAIEEAKGKYIACVDADDIVLPDFLKLPYEKLEKTNVAAVWIKSLIFWESEKKTTKMFTFPDLMNEKEGFLTLSPQILTNYPAYSWNKMFIKDCLNENIFWTEDKLFEDVEFYWRFYTQHPDIYIIDQPLYIYRRHQSSIMSKSIVDIDYHKNLFYVTENIYKFLNEQGLFEKYKETFLKFVAQNIGEFESYDNLKQELAKTVLETMKKINFPENYFDLDKNFPNNQFDIVKD